jgi:hypothetical protein
MRIIHFATASLLAGNLFAASVDIGLYHSEFDRRSYDLPCSALDARSPVTVDFAAEINTWSDIFSIVVRDAGDQSASVRVESARKDRVRGTYSFEPSLGNHTLEVVVTKTSGRVFGDTAVVRIYDDTNGTCPLPGAGE